MDNLPEQNLPQNLSAPKRKPPYLLLILPVTVFIISSSVGFFLSRMFFSANQQPSQDYPLTDTASIPVELELLQNSILSNWSGQVEGKVVAKDQSSFTIIPVVKQYSPDGVLEFKEASGSSTLKIIYIPDKTVIKKSLSDNEYNPESETLNFSDLITNSVISVTVEIYTKSKQPAIIGRTISILK